MSSERWERVKRVVDGALARQGPARDRFISDACAGDTTLRAEVDSLLRYEGGDLLASEVSEAPLVGRVLAQYRIEEEIGRGGMGRVYRAHDTKLRRDVAIKVLPEAFASSPERRKRFEREARLIAALNHPNVATIHGLEAVEGTRFLVLELVGGETLKDRLRRGPLGVREALRIALQIAEALQAAHEAGVVHRDLKPGNVNVTPEGAVKVLDFGLAKDLRETVPGEGTDVGLTATHSPTTQDGVVMGTPSYMSPEQIGGGPVDHRTDVWSFGVILWEMLAGGRLFGGDSTSEILGGVLRDELRWDALPEETPETLRRLLQRCLTRERRNRLQAIGEARIAMEECLAHPQSSGDVGGRPSRSPAWPLLLGLVAAGLAAGAWLGTGLFSGSGTSPARIDPVEFVVSLDAEVDEEMVLTRDGRHLVIELPRNGVFVRSLESAELRPLPGPPLIAGPMTSPDGKWLAYVDWAEKELRRMPLEGGAPITIVEGVPTGFGGSWGSRGTLVYSPSSDSGLWRVPVEGGEPEQLSTPDASADEMGHWYPQLLPDGRILFTVVRGRAEESTIEVLDPAGGTRTVVLRGGEDAHYVPTGHLVYVRRETVWAVPFDPGRLVVTGRAAPVLEGVAYDAYNRKGVFTVSDDGTLAYVRADVWNREGQLVWLDAEGGERPAFEEWGAYGWIELSPEGDRVAVEQLSEGEVDVWVLDLDRGTRVRVTRNLGVVNYPTWLPDGEEIVFSVDAAKAALWRVPWDASGPGVRIPTPNLGSFWPECATPSGDTLVIATTFGNPDLWTVPLSGEGEPRPLRATPSLEIDARLSPDGRWLAYRSDETGIEEIWVDPFPESRAGVRRRQLSTGGGVVPGWSRDGALFYRSEDRIMRVSFDVESGRAGLPEEWLRSPHLLTSPSHAISPDGQRVLTVRPRPGSNPRREVVVRTGWFEDLKQKLD